ncbi:hypothetical protein QQG74_18030 [Micromonospora sp. FIMYZ51]|uniref:hypothetical protein n=1 Tax=Micromonospora sp. FIMYZ51 TaxID=3051832 RepID=UPI00311E1A9E
MSPSSTAAPAELRPHRVWFVVAALVAVGGVLASAVLMLIVLRSEGELGQRVVAGEPVTVTLSADEKLVWVREPGGQLSCAASPLDGLTITGYADSYLEGGRFELTVDGERWRGRVGLSADPAGRYEVTCTVPGIDPPPALAIGDPPRFSGPRSATLATLTAVGVSTVGVLTGVVLAGVVAVRRRRHARTSRSRD